MRWLIAVLALGLAALLPRPAQAQIACESLKGLQLLDVRITDAKAGMSPVNMSPAGAKPVPVCTVTGVIGREINFAVLMPDAWNGKFAMGGQGGSAGSVESQAGLFGALTQGYVIAGTDTGHVAVSGGPPVWAMDPFLGPERQVNFFHAAIHRVTITAKAIIRARYGRGPAKSYFAGCSNGGRQGLMEAQRYPEDFDAILAGAPVPSISEMSIARIDAGRRIFPDPKNFSDRTMDDADRMALGKAVLAACDSQDGLADGILSDPDACKFDPAAISCRGSAKDGCLTAGGLAAVRSWYGGPREKGVAFGPGYPMGGEMEASWAAFLIGPASAQGQESAYAPNRGLQFSMDFFRYFLSRPNWSYAGPTLAEIKKDLQALSAHDATFPDLAAFRRKGGKVLMFHGLIDATLTSRGSVNYLKEVYAHDATAKEDVRLFLLPGVGHCGVGPGPSRTDWITTLDTWASGGPAPEEITAAFAPQADGQSGGARKLCAWPKKQVFKGAGDGRSPDQFECR